MIEVEDKIVSEDLFEEFFCCDLNKCKGECCIEGDSGAPLEEEEISLIEDNIENIKPYMTTKGVQAVERQGVFVIDTDGDYTTTLVDGKECAYTFMENGYTLCAIERAYLKGEISYRKPISCHLYPIRVAKFKNGTIGLNYHRWDICKHACIKGKEEGVKVYQSLREPLERAFGTQFYEYLKDIDTFLESGEEMEIE